MAFAGPRPWIPGPKLTFLHNKNYNRGNVHCSLYNLLHILTDNQFQLCNQWCIEHMNLHSRQCTFSILKWIRVRLTSPTKIPELGIPVKYKPAKSEHSGFWFAFAQPRINPRANFILKIYFFIKNFLERFFRNLRPIDEMSFVKILVNLVAWPNSHENAGKSQLYNPVFIIAKINKI